MRRSYLNEITSTEREIDTIKRTKIITDYTSIMSSNHWDELQHLFAKNFDTDDFNRLTLFFRSCALAEDSVKMIKSFLPIALDYKMKSIQGQLVAVSEIDSDDEYKKKRDSIINRTNKEDFIFRPNIPQVELVNYLENINPLYLSSIGEKLKKIRDKKFFL